MSRSNPTANTPNPSTRWFEWRGGTGILQYFDKEKKENIPVKLPFKFLVLDQLSTVTGYNKKAKSGIHANEIRDSRQDTLVVKFFSGETIAEGLWSQIKKDVVYAKGGFACSCYIAYRDGDSPEMKIGNIRFSGCSLGPWFDFVKKHRSDLDKKAVTIRAGEKDTSGSVDFIPPKFSVVDATEESNAAALELDIELQKFLDSYLKRTRIEQVTQASPHAPEDENQDQRDTRDHSQRPPPHDPDLDVDDADPDVPF